MALTGLTLFSGKHW